jgi:hypothetical protein
MKLSIRGAAALLLAWLTPGLVLAGPFGLPIPSRGEASGDTVPAAPDPLLDPGTRPASVAPLADVDRSLALSWARHYLAPNLARYRAGRPLRHGEYTVVHPVYQLREAPGAAALLATLERAGHGELWRAFVRHKETLVGAAATVRAHPPARGAADPRRRSEAIHILRVGDSEGYGSRQGLLDASRRWIEEALLPTFPELAPEEPEIVAAVEPAQRHFQTYWEARANLHRARKMTDALAAANLRAHAEKVLREGDAEGYGSESDYPAAREVLRQAGLLPGSPGQGD